MARLISESFVPLAVNADRLPDDAAGHLVRAVVKQGKWPQGVWVIDPTGRVRASHYFRPLDREAPADWQARWVRETRAMAAEQAMAAGPLMLRTVTQDPFPDRGVGVRKNGDIRLAVYSRFLKDGRRDGVPVVDGVDIPAKEWGTFQPPKREVGSEWKIPEETVRRLATALGPQTDSIYSPVPADLNETTLTARVESVDGGEYLVRFTGAMRSEHLREGNPKAPIRSAARVDGIARFNAKAGMRSLLLHFDGAFRTVPPYDKPRAYAAVVEWRAAGEADPNAQKK